MRPPAHVRGRRAVLSVALAILGLVTTAAATAARPADDESAHATTLRGGPADDTAAVSEASWIAARVRAVRPVPTLAESLDAQIGDVFATYDGIELVEPAIAPLAIGFHQAGGDHPALTPVGTLIANENPRGTREVRHVDHGPAVRVMASRGRGGSGTSAVDVALPADVPVRAVVAGRVTAVEPYALYGRYDDVLVEIQPTGRPDVRVVMYHLRDVRVRVGDEVYAGFTPIAAGARRIPITNQVDRYADGCPCQHVDIRIRFS